MNGRYLVFFTGGGKNERLSSGVAVAQTQDPFGPYKDIGNPLISSPLSLGGAIDPHYFKDPVTGRDYLLWKSDKPLSLQPSLIYIRELHPSGTEFRVNIFNKMTQLKYPALLHALQNIEHNFAQYFFQGKSRVLLRSNVKTILEERLVAEAPWLMHKNGYYYLLYSSGWTHEPKYHIRVARAKKVTGPYVRGKVPVVTTDWERYEKVKRYLFSMSN